MSVIGGRCPPWIPSLSCSRHGSVGTLNTTLRPGQNGCHFADDTLKRIFLNQNVRNSIKISPKFVPKGRIHNIPSLVQIMAWCRLGDKPLSEPMALCLLTHICVTRPQWDTTLPQHTPPYSHIEAEKWNGRHFAVDIFKCIILYENCCILIQISLKFVWKGPVNDKPALVQIMAWCRTSYKPLFELMMA